MPTEGFQGAQRAGVGGPKDRQDQDIREKQKAQHQRSVQQPAFPSALERAEESKARAKKRAGRKKKKKAAKKTEKKRTAKKAKKKARRR